MRPRSCATACGKAETIFIKRLADGSWRECDVCIPYAARLANKRHIQKRHENFIVALGSRDSNIWSGTWSNGSQMSESNH